MLSHSVALDVSKDMDDKHAGGDACSVGASCVLIVLMICRYDYMIISLMRWFLSEQAASAAAANIDYYPSDCPESISPPIQTTTSTITPQIPAPAAPPPMICTTTRCTSVTYCQYPTYGAPRSSPQQCLGHACTTPSRSRCDPFD